MTYSIPENGNADVAGTILGLPIVVSRHTCSSHSHGNYTSDFLKTSRSLYVSGNNFK